MSPLLLWCLGPEAVTDCRVSCRSCVTPASLDDACWCMSRLQPGLRWAIGRTSPSQSRVACAVDHVHHLYRCQAPPPHMHQLTVGQSMIIHLARTLITGPPASMGTSKASKRRQAQRPGRRERAVERGGAPAAGAEGSTSSSSQWLNMASSSAATSLPCSSEDHSVLAWATGSDATRPWYRPYPRCSGYRPLDIRSMHQQTPLRLTRWTSTCPFRKGSPLIIWTRLGRSRRM